MIELLEADYGLVRVDPWQRPEADEYTMLAGRYKVRFCWRAR